MYGARVQGSSSILSQLPNSFPFITYPNLFLAPPPPPPGPFQGSLIDRGADSPRWCKAAATGSIAYTPCPNRTPNTITPPHRPASVFCAGLVTANAACHCQRWSPARRYKTDFPNKLQAGLLLTTCGPCLPTACPVTLRRVIWGHVTRDLTLDTQATHSTLHCWWPPPVREEKGQDLWSHACL